MGVGAATGKDKAELAAQAAISSPLLETTMDGATGILISINDIYHEKYDRYTKW
jgi:cell division protein FtsZ